MLPFSLACVTLASSAIALAIDPTDTNVSPGSRQFRVIAANQDGVWNTEGASTSVIIPPALYQTRLLYTLCGFALLGLIRQSYRFRLIQIENRLGERLRE